MSHQRVFTRNYESQLRVDIEKVSRWRWTLILAEGPVQYVVRPVRGSYKRALRLAKRWVNREEYL